MAQRFGGQFSPDGQGPRNDHEDGPRVEAKPAPSPTLTGLKRTKIGLRVNALWLLPTPIALFAFGKPPLSMAVALAGYGLLIGAVWLLREGLKAQEAYEARAVARRPVVPRKMIASAATGVGLGLASFATGFGLIGGIVIGALAAALHLVAFGPDPLKDKGMEGVDSFQTNRVATAIEEAEKHLEAMADAIRRAQDRGIEAEVTRFAQTARGLFRRVEEDPRDLTAARKYLSVYLLGARDATAKFADFYARSSDAQARAGARADFSALLTDLGQNFSARTETLILEDRTDLDVEIEVLRERLAREGVIARS